MQWIKVSQRLPVEYEEVYLKFKGHRYLGCYEPEYKTFRGGGHQLFTEAEFSEILWLDEERLDPGFVDYMNAAKDEFVAFINKQDWNNELRTNAESFIIAYDQIAERLVKAVG